MAEPAGILDSHVHFWDPRLRRHDWLATVPSLDRPQCPDHLDAAPHGVTGLIVVEADCRAGEALDEVRWVAGLARREPRIRGMVAHASLEGGLRAQGRVAALAAHPLVVGVRRLLQDEPSDLMAFEPFLDGLGLLATHHLPFDICVRHEQLPAAAAMVARCPEVTFVLDHLGKPPVRAGGLDPWRDDIARLAASPNVVCKLSGLATEAGWERWAPDRLRPYLDHALDTFGPMRCLAGSDWPVLTLAGTYEQWFELLRDATAGLGPSERAAVFAGNAERTYALPGLHEPPTSERIRACSDLRG
jgi:L-fuconolactonase